MTIDDLLLLLGRKEAHIAQLLRHIAQLEARPMTIEKAQLIPVTVDGNAER